MRTAIFIGLALIAGSIGGPEYEIPYTAAIPLLYLVVILFVMDFAEFMRGIIDKSLDKTKDD
jgi:hypothetical protein